MTKIIPLLLALCATGCATTGYFSPGATGFAVVVLTKEAVQAGPGSSFAKVGRACSKNVLGFIAFGDASVSAAKAEGGITEIASVDREFVNVLAFYGSSCTIVHGK